MLGFPYPQHLPCPSCGESVTRGADAEHVCDLERRLDYIMLAVRDEVDGLEDEIHAWLKSPVGRFAVWLAERERRRYL
jgi:hypothetical protein